MHAQLAWERQQREMPVADVTAGLIAEFPLPIRSMIVYMQITP